MWDNVVAETAIAEVCSIFYSSDFSWMRAEQHVMKMANKHGDRKMGRSSKSGKNDHSKSKEEEDIEQSNNDGKKMVWAELQHLMPFSSYELRMYAVNKIGSSDVTAPILMMQTEEEAPEGPPTSIKAVANGSQSLIIKWKVRQCSQSLVFNCLFSYVPININLRFILTLLL